MLGTALLILWLASVIQVQTTTTFSNTPKTLSVAGDTTSQALFTAVNGVYVYSTDTVTIEYRVAPSTSVAQQYYALNVANMFASPSALDQTGPQGTWAQLPIAAYGLVVTTPHQSSLVLDRATLAAIWTGAVSRWDDPAIAALNGGKSPLAGNITLVVTNFTSAADEYASTTGVFARALASFDPLGFGAAYTSSGLMLAAMLRGRVDPAQLVEISLGTGEQRAAVTNGTTYVTQTVALAAGRAWTALVNRAGFVVAGPTQASLASALGDFESTQPVAPLDVDIVDGPGNATWPLAGLVFGMVDASAARSDCSYADALLTLMAWMQFNDGAIGTITGAGFAPLTNGFKRRTADAITNVTCNGQPAISESLYVGAGSPLPTWGEWADAWAQEGGTMQLKYFQTTTLIAQPQVSGYQIDFAGVTTPAVPQAYLARYPDLRTIPIGLHSFAVGYNLPEAPLGSPPLVLSLPVLADIYLARITTWNDSAIVALNPALAPYLPGEPIIVLLNMGGPVNQAGGPLGGVPNQMFARMLSAVPGFSAAVYNAAGTAIHYPVQDTGRTILGQNTPFTQFMTNTSYSVGCYLYSAMADTHAIGLANLINLDGGVVGPVGDSLVAAAAAIESMPTAGQSVNAPGNASWPMLLWDYVEVHAATMPDCRKATTLLDWIYWIQTSGTAAAVGLSEGEVVASRVGWVAPYIIAALARVNCSTTGDSAFSLYPCVTFTGPDTAIMCSGHGACAMGSPAACSCDAGWEGPLCEAPVEATSGVDVTGIAVGAALGGTALCLLLVLVIAGISALAYYVGRVRSNGDGDWQIDFDELELGELLGQGGYGEVYRATWKDTEVAVKTISADRMNKEARHDFVTEIRVMTALRHPNVVLFMAACTKPPNMCIVMEFMGLGSLFDLLHNELVTVIPYALKAKIVYQAAKGMHFLHSSGIVHRDLKSLNLLLDSKWNVKVSDFGLTRVARDARRTEAVGTVQWTAPEVLSECADVDYMLADVYAFGIIMWEVLTREQPYAGLSPAAIAVGVIKNGLRPPLDSDADVIKHLHGDSHAVIDSMTVYIDLTRSCWHGDVHVRPTFLEIMTRMSTAMQDVRGTGDSSMSSSSFLYTNARGTMHTGTSSASTTSSLSDSGKEDGAHVKWQGTPAPDGTVTLIFSDIVGAAALWERDPAAMSDATAMHNKLLRALATAHRGHEAVLALGSGEGTFCMAFGNAADAARWCADVQRGLLDLEWPEALLRHEQAAEELGHEADDHVLFRGVRVRMGVHMGPARPRLNRETGRGEYTGATVRGAYRLTSRAQGGQVLVSTVVVEALRNSIGTIGTLVQCAGDEDDGSASMDGGLWELRPLGLEGRVFAASPEVDQGSTDYTSDRSGVPDGHGQHEHNYLTTANMCRWIIDYKDIEITHREPVGAGSYGVVYRGKWKGVEVAVKRFVKQKLDEPRILELRAEVAFLSDLHHPNVVLLVGACVHAPNLALVTEFVKHGSLEAVLADTVNHRLPFKMRMCMLRGAARGVAYLHSLQPPIIHRDLKPSNLLVDEDYIVKVADFGLARIKEENATMTRCGSPCWTAPEVVRGERYSEKADVYSFGVIAWEVLTRKQPYAGKNFMAVANDVLENRRPQIPADCPEALAGLIEACWHKKPAKRPSMEEAVIALNGLAIEDQRGPA